MTAMSEAAAVSTQLAAAVDACAAASLSSLAEEDLRSAVQEVKQARRRLAALEHRLIAELDERNLPSKRSMPSTSAFLASLLNLSPREAGRRVRHARQLGPRITVTGERLQPVVGRRVADEFAGTCNSRPSSASIR
jgi:hypothetical protein